MARKVQPAGSLEDDFANEVILLWKKRSGDLAVFSESDLRWMAEIAFRPRDLHELESGGDGELHRSETVSPDSALRLAQLYVRDSNECVRFLGLALAHRARCLRSKEWIARATASWASIVAILTKTEFDSVAAQKDLERRLREQGFSEKQIGNSKALIHRALSQLRKKLQPRRSAT